MRRSQLVEAWVDSEEIGSAVWQGGSTPPSLPMIELKLTKEELSRVQLSLDTAINKAEDFLKEAGGDYPIARMRAKEVIDECKDLQQKVLQLKNEERSIV